MGSKEGCGSIRWEYGGRSWGCQATGIFELDGDNPRKRRDFWGERFGDRYETAFGGTLRVDGGVDELGVRPQI